MFDPQPDMTELGKESTKNAPAACSVPTYARMAKMSHVWPTACLSSSDMMTEQRKHQLQLLAWHQQGARIAK
jgi:hypothetical protein